MSQQLTYKMHLCNSKDSKMFKLHKFIMVTQLMVANGLSCLMNISLLFLLLPFLEAGLWEENLEHLQPLITMLLDHIPHIFSSILLAKLSSIQPPLSLKLLLLSMVSKVLVLMIALIISSQLLHMWPVKSL